VLFRGGRFTLEPKRDALEGESCERPAGGGSRPLPKPVPRPTFNHASRRPHPIKPHRASPRLLIRKLELPRRNLRGLPFRVRTVSDAPKALWALTSAFMPAVLKGMLGSSSSGPPCPRF